MVHDPELLKSVFVKDNQDRRVSLRSTVYNNYQL